MRKPSRAPAKTVVRKSKPAAKTVVKASPRRLALKQSAPPQLNADEALRLEQISRRYEESERAWLRMTAPPEGDEPWTGVEEQLISHVRPADSDRRWKYFSK